VQTLASFTCTARGSGVSGRIHCCSAVGWRHGSLTALDCLLVTCLGAPGCSSGLLSAISMWRCRQLEWALSGRASLPVGGNILYRRLAASDWLALLENRPGRQRPISLRDRSLYGAVQHSECDAPPSPMLDSEASRIQLYFCAFCIDLDAACRLRAGEADRASPERV